MIAILATFYAGAFGLLCVSLLIFADYQIGKVLPRGSLSLRVNLSGIGITAASGKISGSVFAKGKGNLYVRVKTKPHNPNTTFQATSRANFRLNSQAWRALTPAQRSSWNAAAINFPRKNKLGNTIQLSGAGLYCSINNNLLAIAQSVITVPPIPTTVLTPLGVTVTTAATVISAAWTSGPIPVATSYEVWATPGLSPGKNFVKSQFRLIQVIAAAGTSPTVITTAYSARFGAYIIGTKIFVYLVAVGTLTGLKSKSNIASVIAA